MIRIEFKTAGDELCGFSLSGHATVNAADQKGKLICAAVSSAVFLTVNTISEIVGADVSVTDRDDLFAVTVNDRLSQSQHILRGFKLHISELAKEYHGKIKIISEV